MRSARSCRGACEAQNRGSAITHVQQRGTSTTPAPASITTVTSSAGTDKKIDRIVGLIVHGLVLVVRSAVGFGIFYLLGALLHAHGAQRWGLAGLGALLPFANDLLDRGQAALRRWRPRHALERGQVLSAIRLLDGHHPGLSSSWTHGSAHVQSGTITFTPWLLSRRRAHTTLHVVAVDAIDPGYRGPGEGKLRIAADHCLITLQTQDARLRWALHPAVLDDALTRLNVPGAQQA